MRKKAKCPWNHDVERIAAMGFHPVSAAVIGETEIVRHDPDRLTTLPWFWRVIDRTVADRSNAGKAGECLSALGDGPKS